MMIRLHKNARTTPAIRAESTVSLTTRVPHHLQITRPAQELLVVELRKCLR
jgi:hypothetical protein